MSRALVGGEVKRCNSIFLRSTVLSPMKFFILLAFIFAITRIISAALKSASQQGHSGGARPMASAHPAPASVIRPEDLEKYLGRKRETPVPAASPAPIQASASTPTSSESQPYQAMPPVRRPEQPVRLMPAIARPQAAPATAAGQAGAAEVTGSREAVSGKQGPKSGPPKKKVVRRPAPLAGQAAARVVSPATADPGLLLSHRLTPMQRAMVYLEIFGPPGGRIASRPDRDVF
ncbi:MAG: hypothetical protein HYU36_17590 [Planctomycetes bacterium]|nr:hypothetical protein [Planctomycetota bacterium]